MQIYNMYAIIPRDCEYLMDYDDTEIKILLKNLPFYNKYIGSVY